MKVLTRRIFECGYIYSFNSRVAVMWEKIIIRKIIVKEKQRVSWINRPKREVWRDTKYKGGSDLHEHDGFKI